MFWVQFNLETNAIVLISNRNNVTLRQDSWACEVGAAIFKNLTILNIKILSWKFVVLCSNRLLDASKLL